MPPNHSRIVYLRQKYHMGTLTEAEQRELFTQWIPGPDTPGAVVDGWIQPGTTQPAVDVLNAREIISPNLAPSARVRRGTNQTITPPENIDFGVVDWDTHGFADVTNQPERLTVPAGLGGIYLVGASLYWTAPGANAAVDVRIQGNISAATRDIARVANPATRMNRVSMTGMIQMEPDDYVVLRLTSATSPVLSGTTTPVILWITRIAPTEAGAK